MKSRGWLLAVLLLIGMAGFVAWRMTKSAPPQSAGPTAPATRPTTGPSPAAQQALSQAITAQLHGDFATARQLYIQAEQIDPTCKGVEFQLGVVAFNLHDYDETRVRLNRSIELKEQIPESYNLLGVMLAEDHHYEEAIEQFKKATAVNPADPQGFYNWSETLRTMNQPQEAEQKVRLAMQRNPNDPLYAYKRRLAIIEQNRDAELNDDLNRQMQLKPPAGDWLLTGAAMFLHRKQYDQAAISMDQARQVMAPNIFFAMIQDPIFLRDAARPQIAPFYHVTITNKNTSPPATQPAGAN